MCKINMHVRYAMNKLQENMKLDNREIGIFISRDCIVTETYTGKTYKYRAYNYITRETKYLGYKKNAIEKENYINLLSKVAELHFYNTSYPEDGEELIDYIFTTVFTSFGFNIRKEQIELSKHMYRAMIEQSISLSDIAVGLGKTHAYIIASIVYHMNDKRKWHEPININKAIIISTSSKRLQKSIVKEYVPEISRMLLAHGIIEEKITAVIRKGRENYICDIRLENYVKSLPAHKKNPREYKTLKNLLESNQADLSNVTGIRNYDRERIKVIPKHCNSCPENKHCRYRNLQKEVNSPKYLFQVTNHNYMIADILKRAREGIPLLPNYKVAIYDEAHKLPDAYISMRTVALEKGGILELIKKVKPKNKKSRNAKLLINNCNEIIKVVNSLFNKVISNINEEMYSEEHKKYPITDIATLRQDLKQLKIYILQIVVLISDIKRKEQIGFEKLGDYIDIIINSDSILWVKKTTTSKQTTICAVSKDINEMLAQDLFKKNSSILMTSGTLAINGDFTYIKKEMGISNINKIREIHKISPFDYYQNTLLYQAKDLPYPDQKDDEYIEQVAQRIIDLIIASYGHVLVLFTSYESMSKVQRLLKNKSIKYPLFTLTKGHSSAIKDYRKSKNGVLLACGSIWEGVNFTGDLLSHLIIVKLPFLIPDPITDSQKSQSSSYEKFKEEILIPQMLTKLKQGYGRAIRTETDTAVISMLDKRANKEYRQVVRQALPDCKITYNIDDITRFIKKKKCHEYFL